jgi:hypothetical protein
MKGDWIIIKTNSAIVKYNNELKLKEKPIMSHVPMFDKMANKREKVKFATTQIRN